MKISVFSILAFVSILFAITFSGCSKGEPASNPEKIFYTGSTMDFAAYLEDVAGAVYKENGIAKNPYKSIKDHGGTAVRLSLEPEPHIRIPAMDEEWVPDIDWLCWYRLKDNALRAKNAGLDIILTLKHEKSVARRWEHIADKTVLGDTLYKWCYKMLDLLEQQNTLPAVVTIGNEINAAFMLPEDDWEAGRYDYARNVFFINRAIDAVRDFSDENNKHIKIAIHLNSPQHTRWWLGEHYTKGATDFDIMAFSYYYGWQELGEWSSFAQLGKFLKDGYGKDFMILETSCPYTWENGDDRSNTYGWLQEGYQPPSPANQRRWMKDFACMIKNAGGLGVISWGTESLPTNAWIYPNIEWGKGSGWENNSYWDFTGNLHEGVNWMQDVK